MENKIIDLSIERRKEEREKFSFVRGIAKEVLDRGYLLGKESLCHAYKRSYRHFKIEDITANKIDIFAGKSPKKTSFKFCQKLDRLIANPYLARLYLEPVAVRIKSLLKHRNISKENWKLVMDFGYKKSLYDELSNDVQEIANKFGATLESFIDYEFYI